MNTTINLARLTHELYYAETYDHKVQDTHDGSCMIATDCNKEISVQQAKHLHIRLGHLSSKHLKILYPNIDINSFKHTLICTICPATKQTQKPFSLSIIKTNRHFCTLHLLDVLGAYSKPTYIGSTLFITIVDDHTRTTWVYII